jgi:hypothetical protein
MAVVPEGTKLDNSSSYFESLLTEKFLDLFSFKISEPFSEQISFFETIDVFDFCRFNEGLFRSEASIFEVTIPSNDNGVFRVIFSFQNEVPADLLARYKVTTLKLTPAVQGYFNFL